MLSRVHQVGKVQTFAMNNQISMGRMINDELDVGVGSAQIHTITFQNVMLSRLFLLRFLYHLRLF